VLWLAILLVLLVSLAARGRRAAAPGLDPFADQRPLSAYTRGVVDRSELTRERDDDRRAA
jgi:hypothetical protein